MIVQNVFCKIVIWWNISKKQIVLYFWFPNRLDNVQKNHYYLDRKVFFGINGLNTSMLITPCSTTLPQTAVTAWIYLFPNSRANTLVVDFDISGGLESISTFCCWYLFFRDTFGTIPFVANTFCQPCRKRDGKIYDQIKKSL